MSTSSQDEAEGLEDDRNRLEAFRRGDRAALAWVFRRYAVDVAKVLRKGVVGAQRSKVSFDLSEHELEGLVQETFVKAFQPRARKRYDGLHAYGAYVCTIARNLLADRGRKMKRERARFVHGDNVDAVSDAATYKGQEDRELKSLMEAFVAALDDDRRRLFELRFVEHLTQAQAAKELGKSVVTVRRRDAQLRLDLLAYLRAGGFLENANVRIGDPRVGRQRA